MKGIRNEKLKDYLDEFMWKEEFNDNRFLKICDLIKNKYSF
jgi:hypothetical protein